MKKALIAIAIMMAIMGTGDDSIVPAVTVGAAICVATSMCADMMADLKTGYLVGGMPRKQQIAQILPQIKAAGGDEDKGGK